ncbi:DUF3047 domain-containing protein [Albidovulum sp.]
MRARPKPARLLPAILALALALALASPLAAPAAPLSFDGGWNEQKFRLFSKNRYGLDGDSLEVRSDGTVSMLWRPLPKAEWGARRARWDWQVERGVPATDLTVKGGDDRNLALYFIFLPRAEAERISAAGGGIRTLLGSAEARVLVYVWGGGHRAGAVLQSPYLGDRGRTVVLHPAGTGAHREAVDLGRDFARAFGAAPGALVGLAISADSDDTDSVIRARISGLSLE